MVKLCTICGLKPANPRGRYCRKCGIEEQRRRSRLHSAAHRHEWKSPYLEKGLKATTKANWQ